MGYRLGLDCKLYWGTAGSTAANLVDNVRNVTLNLEKAEADVTTRGANGWRQMVSTLKEGSVEFEMVWDPANAAFNAIKAAWFNNTAVALAVLDDVAGAGQGLDADFTISNFSRNEQLEEAVTVTVTAKPTYSTRAPAWV